ncbi:hypothetical protein CspeluHIS016_0801270 [Cutaneotrichosporon spelunceum]|uniref:Uncharacterized protein n=1 Tax=Cutaneotrichosporon spelunceum TaxID=1672016 RepID=A0AAD3TZN6_9TREE|nr:hypothetical protein CspeluHIS016_0801270 [Cutaneotrichosporon spelunceum]
MRLLTFAALAAATTVYAVSADEAGASASGSASAPSPSSPNPSANMNGMSPSAPATNGTGPVGSGSGKGLAGGHGDGFRNLSQQCQMGLLSITMAKGSECLHAPDLLRMLGGHQQPGMGSSAPGQPGPSAPMASGPASSPSAATNASAVVAPSGASPSDASPSGSEAHARRQEGVSPISEVPSATGNATGPAAPTVPVSPLPNNAGQFLPALEMYLEKACAAPVCSNVTITEIAEIVINSCQVDLQRGGISNDTVKMIASLYPTAREAACLKTSNPPVYNPAAFAPNQNVSGNSTVPGNSTLPQPSASLPSDGTGSFKFAEASATSVGYRKRQDEGATPSAGANQSTVDPAASPVADVSASPSPAAVSPTVGNPPMAPSPGPMNGTIPNATAPAGNSTNGTFCTIAMLQGLEKFYGKPLTLHDLFQVYQALTNPTEPSNLTNYPAGNLCNDCMYSILSIVETSEPRLLEQSNVTTWFSATCPASNNSLSTNGTLPAGVIPSAEDSTYGFPLTFTNATGQIETTTPNATFTPIGINSNGSGTAWTWPASNSTTPLPTGGAPEAAAPSDAAPSDAVPSGAAPSDTVPSDAAPSDAAPSDAAPSDAAPSDAAVSVTPAARRSIRFGREY